MTGDRVHLLHDVLHVMPCLERRELELDDQPIDLVEHEDGHDVLVPCLLKHCVRLDTYALDSVHDQQRAIGEPRCG